MLKLNLKREVYVPAGTQRHFSIEPT